MATDQIISYCLTKTGAYLDYPFGPDVTVIKVRNRIFAQVFYLKGKPMATFNCDRITGEFYRAVYPNSVTRGYHCPAVQQPYFNTLPLDDSIPTQEILLMIDHSYTVVTSKLPKYIQKELFAANPCI